MAAPTSRGRNSERKMEVGTAKDSEWDEKEESRDPFKSASLTTTSSSEKGRKRILPLSWSQQQNQATSKRKTSKGLTSDWD